MPTHPISRRTLAARGAAILGAAALAGPARAATAARPGADPGPRETTRQLRGSWISTVANIDWPSARGLDAAAQRAELIAYLDDAVSRKHNAVVLQVRPSADTFWPSALEPWSIYLTGRQGQDPGWDPLGVAVEEAHARGLQLHAWFNPYRVMNDAGDPSKLAENHPARVHPEWTVPYGGKLYFDPGNPDARAHVVSVIAEAARAYSIDAVHFDDYFYPYPVDGEVFDDSASYEAHGNGADLAAWRRANITALVDDVRSTLADIDGRIQFGISPFGVWRNAETDPEGSDTTAGVQTYDDLYADTREWARTGRIDYICPQVYWSRTFEAANYDKIVSWWTEQTKGTDCTLVIGEAVYKVGADPDPAWDDPAELSTHLEFTAGLGGAVGGHLFFSAGVVRADPLGAMSRLESDWYTQPALPPDAP